MVAPPPGTVHKPAPPMPQAPKRKAVQLAAVTQSGATYPDLFALCDDGTIWQMLNHESYWQQLPDIPQSE